MTNGELRSQPPDVGLLADQEMDTRQYLDSYMHECEVAPVQIPQQPIELSKVSEYLYISSKWPALDNCACRPEDGRTDRAAQSRGHNACRQFDSAQTAPPEPFACGVVNRRGSTTEQ